jgi:FAD/FMN-containing dehydrogenase
MVLAGGEVVELGGAALEPSTYDLVGVVVGSEGCFGLVTEIEVRLLPVPQGVRTFMAVFEQLDEAARAVTSIIATGLLPAALEIMDQASIRAVEASVFAAGYPVDAGAVLLVEFDGTDAGLDADVARAVACCEEAGVREIRGSRTEEERAALWKGRKKAFGAMGRLAPDLVVQDATVPRTKLPEVLRRVGEIAASHGLHVANVFHAGDGNLHPKLLFDRQKPDEVERVKRASREIMEACVAVGGTITGEHGVGVDKREYMDLVHSPADLAAMAAVKAVFDPRGLVNPGKVIPEWVVADPGVGARGGAEAGPS